FRERAERASADVDAALLVLGVLPPPPPGARVLAGRHRARAGGAADRWIAAVVQRVDRDLVRVGVGAHLGRRPGDERVQLGDAAAVAGVDLDLGGLRAGHRLLAAQAGHPGVQRGQHAAEGLDLADAAALVPVVQRVTE